MKWVENRWLDALLKFVVLYVAFHIFFVISGIVVGASPSIVGSNFLWSHLSNITWFNYLIAGLASLAIYLVIYFLFTKPNYFSFRKKEK